VPGLEGSDAYGFIVSKEKLTAREIQQIEADYWGEDFDEVYDPDQVITVRFIFARARDSPAPPASRRESCSEMPTARG